MKNSVWVLMLALLAVPMIGIAAPQQDKDKEAPLPWAYAGEAPPTTPVDPTAQPDPTPRHVAGSDLTFTVAQIRNGYGPADWHPEDHGAIPDIVAHGKKPGVTACALCHYPNGKGRAENAGVAGLPVEYFLRQLTDFKNGLRNSSEVRKRNAKLMGVFANAMTDDEMRAAAEYFGSIPWSPWIKVIETDTVPKTRIESDGLFVKLEGTETEPLGNRIIEVPENTEATTVLRDDHSPLVAYVPVGSIKKGEALVTTGGAGKTVACGICHGTNLEGIGPVPPLAGRSPSYLARQIYDFQHGSRRGSWSGLMKRPVEKLTADDIVNICAYVSSRPVPSAARAASAGALSETAAKP
jgi:cytochrome c553